MRSLVRMACRLVSVLFLIAAGLRAQQYPFLFVDHSPRNIERILEDRQGRLWVSTHDDLLCFDGSRFFSLHDFRFPAVLSYALTEDGEGGILSGSERGVYRYYRGRLEHIISGLFVYEMAGVAPGVFLATVYRNADIQPLAPPYRIRRVGGAWQAEKLTGWEIGISLTRDRNGSVLTACPGGWCEIPAKLVVDWSPGRPSAPILHKSGPEINRVLRDRFGCLWFRSVEGASYQCPSDVAPVPLAANIAGRNVWAAVTELEDGVVMFPSAGPAWSVPGGVTLPWPPSGGSHFGNSFPRWLHLGR
jgi:hypothetical protein